MAAGREDGAGSAMRRWPVGGTVLPARRPAVPRADSSAGGRDASAQPGWPVSPAASSGRVYNAYNGGTDNFEADRALAGQVVAIAEDAAGRAGDLAGFALAAAAVIAADVGQ